MKKGQYEYCLRWDDVTYEPGELKVVAFKDGKESLQRTLAVYVGDLRF